MGKSRISVITSFFLLPLLNASLALAASHSIQANWSELPRLIAGKRVSLVLPDTTSVQGMALAVHADALILDIENTSDGRSHPKGEASIPRSSVSLIERKERNAKIGAMVGSLVGACGGAALGGLAAWSSGSKCGPSSCGAGLAVGILAGGGGGGVAGYFAGRHFDHNVTLIRVVEEGR